MIRAIRRLGWVFGILAIAICVNLTFQQFILAPSINAKPGNQRTVLAEYERELISERTIAGLAAARARGRKGGRPFKMTPAKVRLAAASMGKPGTNVGELCKELGITRQTLYRHVSPTGELRDDGHKILDRR